LRLTNKLSIFKITFVVGKGDVSKARRRQAAKR
jgi:hypothetical protein